MSFLLLYVGENHKFDSEKIKQIFQQSSNVRNLGEGTHGTLIQCEYALDDDFTVIRLKDDLETIVIEGGGKSSMQAAMDIQGGYNEPIHLIDEGYSFDIVLADCDSVEELIRHIEKAEV